MKALNSKRLQKPCWWIWVNLLHWFPRRCWDAWSLCGLPWWRDWFRSYGGHLDSPPCNILIAWSQPPPNISLFHWCISRHRGPKSFIILPMNSSRCCEPKRSSQCRIVPSSTTSSIRIRTWDRVTWDPCSSAFNLGSLSSSWIARLNRHSSLTRFRKNGQASTPHSNKSQQEIRSGATVETELSQKGTAATLPNHENKTRVFSRWLFDSGNLFTQVQRRFKPWVQSNLSGVLAHERTGMHETEWSYPQSRNIDYFFRSSSTIQHKGTFQEDK